MPSNGRIDRINEQVTRELAGILRSVKDPRISEVMLSVLRCDVTRDLRWCKVYLSVLGEYEKKRLLQGLKSCSGFLRSELAHSLSLRYTPELIFELDSSIAHGAHISQVLRELDIQPGSADGNADGNEEDNV